MTLASIIIIIASDSFSSQNFFRSRYPDLTESAVGKLRHFVQRRGGSTVSMYIAISPARFVNSITRSHGLVNSSQRIDAGRSAESKTLSQPMTPEGSSEGASYVAVD